MTHLAYFLETLKTELPEVCADKDLIDRLPNIFKSLSSIHRMRARGQVPPHFIIDPYIYYLKEDVLAWLRSRYQCPSVKVDRAISISGLTEKNDIVCEARN